MLDRFRHASQVTLSNVAVPGAAVVCLTLAALTRWLRAALPAGADTAIHLLRAVELEWAIRHGYLYPRWAPDLAFGFGYPLFNVYGPGAQYLIVALHALGLNFISATLGAFVAADLLGAMGAFVLARATLGVARGALVAAAAYAYAPYVLGSLYRGSAAEALALGLLPWLLWAFYRLYHAAMERDGAIFYVVVAAGLYALFPFLHNPSTVLASGAVLALLLGLAWVHRETRPLSSLRLPVLALGLGLLLSAFYWAPAVLEIGYLQIERAYAPNVLNYHFNFLSLAEVLSGPQPFDPRLIGVSAPRSLGWPQLLLAVIGWARWSARKAETRMLLNLAAVGVILAVFLTLSPSVWIWDHVPGLSLIQFPSRLLGPASLLLAFLAGAAVTEAPSPAPPSLRVWAASGGLSLVFATFSFAAIVVFGFTWTFQGDDDFIPADATIATIHAFERRTGSIGTTTAGEYLPIWVKALPPADALEAAYAADPIVNRLDEASLPRGTQVLEQAPGLISEQVELIAPSAGAVVFNVFYFPGWRAAVDGREVGIVPSTPQGLITISVPAGRHTIEIRFGSTPVRAAGAAVSLVASLLWGALLVVGWKRRPRLLLPDRWPARYWALPGIALILFVCKVVVVDRQATVFARSRFDGAAVAGVQNPLAVDFSDQMQLLGYDQAQLTLPADGILDVALYWRVLQPLAQDYSVAVLLEDSAGHRFGESNAQHPAGFPTSRWPVESYGLDRHQLTPWPGTPPGAYRLMVSVYHYPDLTALTAEQYIGQVTITRPARAAELKPARLLSAPVGPLELIGADVGLAEVGVGADLPLTLYWRALAVPAEDFGAHVALVRPDGTAAVERDLAPVRPDYPTSMWQAGEALRAPLGFEIPADLAGGDYAVTVSLAGKNGPVAGPISVGNVHVVAPERSFVAPAMPHTTDARFGTVAELLGWGLQSDRLTLYWRALGTADRSYTVFVHVLDAGGSLVSQHDTPPIDGARPTTGWLAGEVLMDPYALELPSGAFTLAVGLYDQTSGERLRLPDGADHIVLMPEP